MNQSCIDSMVSEALGRDTHNITYEHSELSDYISKRKRSFSWSLYLYEGLCKLVTFRYNFDYIFLTRISEMILSIDDVS